MCASAAARGFAWTPLAKAAFRPTEAGEDAVHQCGPEARVRNIGNILRESRHSISQLSMDTGERYGSGSPYFIPPTFLYKLRSGVTPHLCQIVALSATTGYRFVDWMQIFGFDLHRIPSLQVQMHPERTVPVTPIEFETAGLRSPSLRSHSSAVGETVCSSSVGYRPGDRRPATGRYWFAKIGSGDALASRKLSPGTIVRVDRCYRQWMDAADNSCLHNLLWLVEHPGGLTCCQLKWIGHHQVILLPSRPPWGRLPLCVPTEARILGLVDFERGSVRPEILQPRAGPGKLEQPASLSFERGEMRFPDLLRAARRRTGLTFRAAHLLTGSIAQSLASRDYAISLGLLSDYEAMGRLPRHVAKIISLCVAYCLDLRQLMEAAGVYIDDSNKMPLPILDPLVASDPDFHDTRGHYRTIGLGAGGASSPRGSSAREYPRSKIIHVTGLTGADSLPAATLSPFSKLQ